MYVRSEHLLNTVLKEMVFHNLYSFFICVSLSHNPAGVVYTTAYVFLLHKHSSYIPL
jgi:hypothetical protein